MIISKLLPRKKSQAHETLPGVDENNIISGVNKMLPLFSCGLFTIMDNWDVVDNSCYSQDGVHLSVKGNRLLAENIRSKVLAMDISSSKTTSTLPEAAKYYRDLLHSYHVSPALSGVDSMYRNHICHQLELSRTILGHAAI